MTTIIEQIAHFAANADATTLPDEVTQEAKRLLLDSLGCALEAVDERGARIGVEYARVLGGTAEEATIIGLGERSSITGAAFANAELINALDHDAILPPGHVTPYVLPSALAVAEQRRMSGRAVIAAIAVAHELSYRLGKAMDYLRDIKDGVVTPPKVTGYSATVFGAAAAVAMVKELPAETVAHALGVAGSIAPVNAHRAWMMHAPSTTIKYLLSGHLAQTALTAVHMAEFGHRGDIQTLDDREYGFPRFIGTTRWEPAPITDGLGEEWRFPAEQSYKPYPHCRIMHGLFDALTDVLEQHDIRPDEIEAIRAWGESFVQQPLWLNTDIGDVRDAQFSMAHGLAVAAQRVPPGRGWQEPEVVFSEPVLDLMGRVTYAPHPDYDQALADNPAARLSRIEVDARGQTFSQERLYPKGSPSPDPSTSMSTEELVAKFLHNASGTISDADAKATVDAVLALEDVADIGAVLDLVRGNLRVPA